MDQRKRLVGSLEDQTKGCRGNAVRGHWKTRGSAAWGHWRTEEMSRGVTGGPEGVIVGPAWPGESRDLPRSRGCCRFKGGRIGVSMTY